MVVDLSPSELSELWLLRGRHTSKKDVEKAIHRGLPLWPEAVHMARAYHRSKKDLAGGKYYIIGSEFIENEPDSPYSYREFGRYPVDWPKFKLYRSQLEKTGQAVVERSEKDCSRICDGVSSSPFKAKEPYLKDTSANVRFEDDRNKHIELLLGGVSAVELENLQSEPNSLDICQISEDERSECEVEDVHCRSRLDIPHRQQQILSGAPMCDKQNAYKKKTSEGKESSNCKIVQAKEKALSNSCETNKKASVNCTALSVLKPKVYTNNKMCSRKSIPTFDEDFAWDEEEIRSFLPEEFINKIKRQCWRPIKVRDYAPILTKEEFIARLERERAEEAALKGSTLNSSSEEEVTKIDDVEEQFRWPDIPVKVRIPTKEEFMAELLREEAARRESLRSFSEEEVTRINDNAKPKEVSEGTEQGRDDGPIYTKEEFLAWFARLQAEEAARKDSAQRRSSEKEVTRTSDNAKPKEVSKGPEQVIVPEVNTEKIEKLCADSSPVLSADKNTLEEKAKRCYVYPFDDSASIVGSEYSDDDAIGTDIFFEISEHRREEGASSPSACSDDSQIALPPNVFMWLPQTCDVKLLTRFRCPSPNATFDVVLPSPRTDFVDLSVAAPKHEEVLVSSAFTKNFCHSGAFALNRGPLRCRAASLKCKASTASEYSIACCIKKEPCIDWCRELSLSQKNFLRAVYDTAEPQSVDIHVCLILTSDKANVIDFAVERFTDFASTYSSYSCYAAKYEDIVSSWVFDIQASIGATVDLPVKSSRRTSYHCKAARYENIDSSWVFDVKAGSGATVVLPGKSRRRTSYRCKARRSRKRRMIAHSASKRKRSDSIKECLMLLETGAMPSQYIDVGPCSVNSANLKVECVERPSFITLDSSTPFDEQDQRVFGDAANLTDYGAPFDERVKAAVEDGVIAVHSGVPFDEQDQRVLENAANLMDYCVPFDERVKTVVEDGVIAVHSGVSFDEQGETVFEDSVSQRSDCSYSPDRLVIVEDLDSEQELEMSNKCVTELSSKSCDTRSGSSCVRVASDCLHPSESVIKNAGTSTIGTQVSENAVFQLPSKEDVSKSYSDTTVVEGAQSAQNGAQFVVLSTSMQQGAVEILDYPDSPLVIKKRRRKTGRGKAAALNDVLVDKAPESGSPIEMPEVVSRKKQGILEATKEQRRSVEFSHINVKKVGQTQEGSSAGVVSSDTGGLDPADRDPLCFGTSREQQFISIFGDSHVNSGLDDTASKTLPSCVFQEDPGRVCVVNNRAVTRKKSRKRPFVEDIETRNSSTEAKGNILPSYDVLGHGQALCANAKAKPIFGVTERPKTYEDTSQDVTLLPALDGYSRQGSIRSRKRPVESATVPIPPKRGKYRARKQCHTMQDARKSMYVEQSPGTRSTRSQVAVSKRSKKHSVHEENSCQESVGQKSIVTGVLNDDVVLIKSCRHRRRSSSTPPILAVEENITSSFVPVKRDNNRCADPITLPKCNLGEAVKITIFSSDSAEILDSLALDIIIKEASVLSVVNLATFAQLVFSLLEASADIFGELVDSERSSLPTNFTTIFERATPLQYRHRLDYNSFSTMLIDRLPENGLHALTVDARRVSMLKITQFVDTITDAVNEICEELRTRNSLSKVEIQAEKDLSSEVQQLIASRYVETMMKLADACKKASGVPLQLIADRFHLLLYGWDCFLQQGGVLRVRLQLSPGRSHPGIVDITTAWLDQIDTVLSRAQATLSTRTSAFAVSLAQEKNVMSKIWHKMAMQTSSTFDDESFIHCSECNLYFHNEDTDFMHNRVFHQKSRECEECYDLFHTLLGLDLHMVGHHKRTFVRGL